MPDPANQEIASEVGQAPANPSGIGLDLKREVLAGISAGPERIWLQNAADIDPLTGERLWCEDKVWPADIEDGEPVEYVRADLLAAAEAKGAAQMRERAMRAAADCSGQPHLEAGGGDMWFGYQTGRRHAATAVAAIRSLSDGKLDAPSQGKEAGDPHEAV